MDTTDTTDTVEPFTISFSCGKALAFFENPDLAGGCAGLFQGQPLLEAGLLAGLQREAQAAVALVRLPVVVPREQYLVGYAFRESLAAGPAILQAPAE